MLCYGTSISINILLIYLLKISHDIMVNSITLSEKIGNYVEKINEWIQQFYFIKSLSAVSLVTYFATSIRNCNIKINYYFVIESIEHFLLLTTLLWAQVGDKAQGWEEFKSVRTPWPSRGKLPLIDGRHHVQL